jgi:acetolactate synthase-1/2/3 large subunit
VIFAGASTDSASTDGWKLPDPRAGVRAIQIDVSERELGNNYRVMPLLGDASETLRAITKFLKKPQAPERTGWAARAARARGEFDALLDEFERSIGDALHPFAVSRVLERLAPEDAFFAIDPGISAVYPAAFTRLAKAGRRTAYNFAMGSLGYAIPSAIGAKAGLPDRAVIGLVGDGSFGFAAGELETAVRLGLDVTYIVFDNESFGWIRGTEFVSRKSALPPNFDKFTEFAGVDYVKIAEGFGLKGYSVDSKSAFERALTECLAGGGAKLIAVKSLPEDRLLAPVPGWYKFAKSVGMENLYGGECVGGHI